MTRPARDGRGQTSLLIVGFTVVLALMVAVVVDASAAYLWRAGLDTLADGAALAAADAVEGRQVYEGGLDRWADLDPAAARGYVAAYLRASGAAQRYPGLRYDVEVGTERVVVRVAAPLDLPLTPPGWERQPTVTATAAALAGVSR